ncbi:MAG: hypothetical protein WCI11_15345 [Candidatus Methylumidiphilus sp.]
MSLAIGLPRLVMTTGSRVCEISSIIFIRACLILSSSVGFLLWCVFLQQAGLTAIQPREWF